MDRLELEWSKNRARPHTPPRRLNPPDTPAQCADMGAATVRPLCVYSTPRSGVGASGEELSHVRSWQFSCLLTPLT